MTIFGLSDLVTQIIPEFAIGPVELRVPYFVFIAVTLAILFDPFSVAIGSAFGSVIFGGLLIGNFGGRGEIEVLTIIISNICWRNDGIKSIK